MNRVEFGTPYLTSNRKYFQYSFKIFKNKITNFICIPTASAFVCSDGNLNCCQIVAHCGGILLMAGNHRERRVYVEPNHFSTSAREVILSLVLTHDKVYVWSPCPQVLYVDLCQYDIDLLNSFLTSGLGEIYLVRGRERWFDKHQREKMLWRPANDYREIDKFYARYSSDSRPEISVVYKYLEDGSGLKWAFQAASSNTFLLREFGEWVDSSAQTTALGLKERAYKAMYHNPHIRQLARRLASGIDANDKRLQVIFAYGLSVMNDLLNLVEVSYNEGIESIALNVDAQLYNLFSKMMYELGYTLPSQGRFAEILPADDSESYRLTKEAYRLAVCLAREFKARINFREIKSLRNDLIAVLKSHGDLPAYTAYLREAPEHSPAPLSFGFGTENFSFQLPLRIQDLAIRVIQRVLGKKENIPLSRYIKSNKTEISKHKKSKIDRTLHASLLKQLTVLESIPEAIQPTLREVLIIRKTIE